MKIRFKILINWHNEVHTFYKVAHSDRQAMLLATKELAYKVGYEVMHVRRYVENLTFDRWKIVERRKI
jgi:hypothetical protein